MKKTLSSAIEQHHIFGLITGPVGCGKTFALGTLPEKETVLLDIEGGFLTLKEKNFEVWKIETVDELKEAYGELKNGTKFKHVGIDSLTEMSEKLFTSLRPNFTKAQNFGLYEEYNRQMIGIVKLFRDLINYNIWFTCLTKETDRGLTLDVAQKSLGTRLPQYFDLSCYVQRFETDDKLSRALLFDSSEFEFCKTRCSKIDQFEKVNLTNITNKIFKEKNQ